MRFSYVVFFDATAEGEEISPADVATVRRVVGEVRRLSLAHLYTPAIARDIYNDDGSPPPFGLQLYFDEIVDLEAAVGDNGPLQALADPGALPSLGGAGATQQAMVARFFPVVEEASASARACSYVVHYEGPADDYNAWIAHYMAHHPPIMKRFPGIRQIEILTRMDWTDAMPWRRVHHMQRNRVMFDNAAALTAALQSPVRHEMRADFATFPPYQGGNYHYPMETEIIRLQALKAPPESADRA